MRYILATYLNMKTKKNIKNNCITCGKKVRWGVNGCPIVEKGKEINVLLGNYKGMIHYDCKAI